MYFFYFVAAIQPVLSLSESKSVWPLLSFSFTKANLSQATQVWPIPGAASPDLGPRGLEPLDGIGWAQCAEPGFTCSCQGLVRMELNATGNSSSLALKKTPPVSVTSSVDCTVPALRKRLWPELRTAGSCEFRFPTNFRLKLGPYCLHAPRTWPATNGWVGPGLTANCLESEISSTGAWVYHAGSGHIRQRGLCLTAVTPGNLTGNFWQPMLVTLQTCGDAGLGEFHQNWEFPEISETSEARMAVGRLKLRAPAELGRRCLRISRQSTKFPITEPALFLDAALCAGLDESPTAEVLWEISRVGNFKGGEPVWQSCVGSSCADCGQAADCELRGKSGNFFTTPVSPPGVHTPNAPLAVCSVDALRNFRFPEEDSFAAPCFCQASGRVQEIWDEITARLEINS